MKLSKRAVIRLRRKKIQTLAFLAIIITIGSIVSGAISVTLAVRNTSENVRRNVPPIITVENLWTIFFDLELDERSNFFRDVLHEAGNLPHVEIFEYSIVLQLQSLYLRQYDTEARRDFLESMGSIIPPPGKGFDNLLLQGFSRPEIIYIINGELELVAGRTFTTQEINPQYQHKSSVAVISRTLAEENDLWVGDTFSLSVTKEWDQVEDRIDFEFEIIGIRDYVSLPQFELEEFEDSHIYFDNLIFVPNWIVLYAEQYLYRYASWGSHANSPTPHFILKNPSYVDNFLNEVQEIFPDGIIFNDYSSRFTSILHSTDAISDIFTTFLMGGILATVMLITLLNILLVNERRQEIGIYLALGETKSKLLIQFAMEQVFIALFALTISLFIGNIISNQISTNMVRNELIAFDEQRTWHDMIPTALEMAFAHEPLTHEDLIQAFDVSLNLGTVVAFYAVSFVVVSLSTLIPTVLILRLNPKEILL